MKRFIPVFFLLLAVLSGCGKKGRVISRSDFVDIYADMLLADAWLQEAPDARRQADTSAFYEPIFRKYGYTTLDYDRSVFKYLRDPEKFSKILSDVQEKLRVELNDLRKLKKKSDEAKALNEMIRGYEDKDFEIGDIPKLWKENAAADTLVAADTLAEVDTLARIDTLVRTETLAAADTLAEADAPAKSDTEIKSENIIEKCITSKDSDILPIREKPKTKLKESLPARKALPLKKSF